MSSTSAYRMVFVVGGLVARVRRLRVHEGLSIPLEIGIEIEVAGSAAEPRAWLLGAAAVHVYRAGDGAEVRQYCGIVTRARERISRASGLQRIDVWLESGLARLKLVTDYRIFQHATTREIVSTMLSDAGVDATKSAWRLIESYAPREVCTQFGETSFDFANRLLEEEGIFHFVEHGADGDVLVFGDSSSAYTPTVPSADLVFMDETGLTSEEAITELRPVARLRAAKVTLGEHDFKRPALDLTAVAEQPAPLGRQWYDYPGRYAEPSEGDRRARVRLEAMIAASTGVVGRGTVLSATAGHTFTLHGAPGATDDIEWVVRRIEHFVEDTAERARCEVRFHLLPKDVPFRPPQATPRARVNGPHVAKVAGPPGEEIHCDEHGRVKLLFPWDRRANGDETSSGWVRVTQLCTTGAVAIPRVGWEVLVEFEDGDPDKPIVTGRLYNAKLGPPYALPTHKTRSALQSNTSPGGGGSNEIRMEDAAGREQIYQHAQKDCNVSTANNRTERVATNSTHAVGARYSLSIGADQNIAVGASNQLGVGSSQTWDVGASRAEFVGAAKKIDVTGSRTTTIGGSHTTMTPMAATVGTNGPLSETVGGTCIEAAALAGAISVAGSCSVIVGGAKMETVAAGKSDTTVGARASTVGGAFISTSGKDLGVSAKGVKTTAVGGAWVVNAGGDVELSSASNLSIVVGGALALNGASDIVMKVGGSTVTIGSGGVNIATTTIKLTATGPHPELAPIVGDK